MPFKSEKQRKWMWANEPEMAEKWANEEDEIEEGVLMKITKRQLGRIIREAIIAEAGYDQLPYDMGGPWVDKDVPTGKGASSYDSLDTELTDEEMDAAGYFEEESWPLRFGYTDKTGEKVEFIANNNDDADEFFAMLFKEYGRDYPYSVN